MEFKKPKNSAKTVDINKQSRFLYSSISIQTIKTSTIISYILSKLGLRNQNKTTVKKLFAVV